MSEPVDRSTIWPYDERGEVGDFFYQRFGSPTVAAAEAAVGELDGGTALLFPSGAGATTALVLSLLEPGDTIALARGGYYGTGVTFATLAAWGLGVVEFDQTGTAPEDVQLVWLEAPSNPYLTMPNLAAAAAHPAPVVVDATVATPVHLRPLEHGADFVLHSATKYLAGHDDALLGVVVCRDDAAAERAADVPHPHRDRGRAGSRLAPAARAEDPRAPRAAPDRDRRVSWRSGCGRIRRSRPSAIPASAGSSPSTSPTPRRRGRWRRRPARS